MKALRGLWRAFCLWYFEVDETLPCPWCEGELHFRHALVRPDVRHASPVCEYWRSSGGPPS